MTKNELDLWSNINNPNNNSNLDDWSDFHNPNRGSDDDDELEIDHSRDWLGYKSTRRLFPITPDIIDKNEMNTIELVKEAIKCTSGNKGYSFISEITLYIAHIKTSINYYKVNSEFINKHPTHFKTFFLEHHQSNMSVQIRE